MISKYKIYPLKKFIKQIRGVSYKKDQISEKPIKDFIPLLRATNIQNGELTFEDLLYVEPSLVKDEQKFKKGDILIAASSGSKEVVGKPGQVKEDGNYTFGAFCKLIRPNNNIIPDYLRHFFNTDYYSQTISHTINGANINNLRNEHIDNLLIPLPSLEIQRKIAVLLNKAQNLMDCRKAQIEALDQLTQSVFLEMFGDPVLNPKEWPKLTMPSFVSKEKYSIKRGPFGGALKKEIFVNQGYLVYEQHHAINNDFSMARYFISEEKFDELKAFEVKPNDLIISCSGTLGKIAEVPENAPKGIINQALLKLTLDKNKMNNTFFIHLFRNQGIQNILFGTSHGSGIKNFPPMSVVKSVEFICPPIDEQKKFETKFKQITKKRERFELSLKEIENLYNALMQRAFNGELFTEEKASNF
ncbi:Type I restriction-modification system, specificity subunit S [Caldibacillus thermoamylovorans]|uniref:restriction endonuclease subunit S n=1 Tax=Caldibacillus thermoamylovorans TaxID=35841 RepID=UPI0005B73D3B|nr:restriction endonuclease subunit S [Caldibacillus thermoamylovorans]KIO67127.1 Type I restriction-modification system, specificity subunit S [Caldibacillus thermoamylovorans]